MPVNIDFSFLLFYGHPSIAGGYSSHSFDDSVYESFGLWWNDRTINYVLYSDEDSAAGEYYVSLNASEYYDYYFSDSSNGAVDSNGGRYIDKAVLGRIGIRLNDSGYGGDFSANAASEAAFDALEDISAALFSDASEPSGGYLADFGSGSVTFTIRDVSGIYSYITISLFGADKATSMGVVPNRPAANTADTYFEFQGVYSGESDSSKTFALGYEDDSYYYNGYQTVFQTGTASVENGATVYPLFRSGENVAVYASSNTISGEKQISGRTAVTYNTPIQYSAAAEDGVHLKNYWVTAVTPQTGGAKLFVNGATNAAGIHLNAALDDGMVNAEDESDSAVTAEREVIFDSPHGYYHDIFVANIGDEPLTGLTVELKNAENVRLDTSVAAAGSLGAFTPASASLSGFSTKIRLVPAAGSTGDVSGTLVITAGNGESVTLNLTSKAGVGIVTETLLAGVKYVPYASVIQTSSMHASDRASFKITSGGLPDGIALKANGEIYGVPEESGEWTFTVQAAIAGAAFSREYTLSIRNNTDRNVNAVNRDAQGYSLVEPVALTNDGILFHSAGAYGNFVDLWLDGKKLREGTDYTKEDGSTKITIDDQTYENAGSGSHTIAAEFRVNQANTNEGDLRRTAQNYTYGAETVASEPLSAIGSLDITARTSTDGTTVVEAFSQASIEALAAEPAVTTVELDLTGLGAAAKAAVLPAELFKRLSEIILDGGNRIENLLLRLTSASVSLDENAFRAILEQSGSQDIRLDAAALAAVDLPAAEKNAVGDMAIYGGVRISVSAGGIGIRDFNGGKATVGIPFDVPAGESPRDFSVFQVTEDGVIRHASAFKDGFLGFRTAHFSDYVIAADPAPRYADILNDAWYVNEVDYVTLSDIMIGVGSDSFAPDSAFSRAMAVQILYNLESDPRPAPAGHFTDVPAEEWYAAAVNWAAEAGVVNGIGGGLFDPTANITRQQLATILFNYAGYKNYSTDHSVELTKFNDAGQVAPWAESAMRWALAEKLFVGVDAVTLQPAGNATRAQAAKVVTCFLESFVL